MVFVDIGGHDCGTLARKQLGDCFTNPHRHAGYERYAIFQTHL
jgi:hypothetical protein